MYQEHTIQKPVFEIGLKAYLYGEDAVRFAQEADRVSREYGVTIILTPQHVDIHAITRNTTDILVFAQHMEGLEPGRGVGSVLPEAVKAAGAWGTLLNHAERRLSLAELATTIRRADETGLMTMVCADSVEEVAAVAALRPNMILAEPPELIGGERSVADMMSGFVTGSIEAARRIDPRITVMCSAGIRTPHDVASVINLGVDATGTSSGILLADDPIAQMHNMVRTLKDTWLARQA